MALLDLLAHPDGLRPPFEVVAVHIDHGFDPAYEGYGRWSGTCPRGVPVRWRRRTTGPVAHSEVNGRTPASSARA
jgi:hypothetical protein